MACTWSNTGGTWALASGPATHPNGSRPSAACQWTTGRHDVAPGRPSGVTDVRAVATDSRHPNEDRGPAAGCPGRAGTARGPHVCGRNSASIRQPPTMVRGHGRAVRSHRVCDVCSEWQSTGGRRSSMRSVVRHGPRGGGGIGRPRATSSGARLWSRATSQLCVTGPVVARVRGPVVVAGAPSARDRGPVARGACIAVHDRGPAARGPGPAIIGQGHASRVHGPTTRTVVHAHRPRVTGVRAHA